MYGYECECCHGLFDAGELKGGICDECQEKMSSERRREKEMDRMVRSADYEQMEMEEFLNGR